MDGRNICSLIYHFCRRGKIYIIWKIFNPVQKYSNGGGGGQRLQLSESESSSDEETQEKGKGKEINQGSSYA